MGLTKPTAAQPDWVTADATKRIEPSGAKKTSGYAPAEPLGAKQFNWLMYSIDQWIKWAEGSIDQLTSSYVAVLGTTADVTAGLADFDDPQDAYDAANVAGGGRVLVLPGTHAGNLVMDENDGILLQGSGQACILSGNVTISGTHNVIVDVLLNGDITITGDNNIVKASQNPVKALVDSGDGNIYELQRVGKNPLMSHSGIPPWTDYTTYMTGQFVRSGGVLYVSLADNNLNNAVTVVASWSPYGIGLPWSSTKSYSINDFVSSSGLLYISLANANLNNAVTDTTKWKLSKPGALNPQANAVLSARALATWTARTEAETLTWASVCFSPELQLYCAVGTTGTNRVQTSPDGITWTPRAASAAKGWISVCWAAELRLFVAVSPDNGIMTSPDGTTWTSQTPAGSGAVFYGITWSPELGILLAIGDTATDTDSLQTSPDGVTWTVRTGSSTKIWDEAAWSPELSLFAAVAATGEIMTSPDGITWTARTSGVVSQFTSICWSPELGIFVAVAAAVSDNVVWSRNGIAWNITSTGVVAQAWQSVCWAAELGEFIAVSTTGTDRVMTSRDGVSWTARSASAANSWNGVVWGGSVGRAVAVASGGTNRVMSSKYVKKFIAA